MITYRCKHCRTEIGSIPFALVEKTIRELQQADETSTEQFVRKSDEGKLEVYCICIECEQTMKKFPDYYTIETWLQ